MKRVVMAVVVVALLVASVSLGAGCRAKPVVLGVVPVEGIDNLSLEVAPLAQALAASLKREVIPRVYMSDGRLIEALGTGECDTAVLPAFAYVVAHDRYGANVVLRGLHGGVSELRYEFLTRPDTGIVGPNQMSAAKVAVPAAAGTPEQQYLLTFLKRYGAADKAVSLPDDQAAFAALLARTVDVAAVSYGFRDCTRLTMPDIDTKVQLVWISDGIPFEAVAVGRQAKAAPAAIQRAWLDLASKPAFVPALRALYGIDGLIPAADSNFAAARETVQTLGINIR